MTEEPFPPGRPDSGPDFERGGGAWMLYLKDIRRAKVLGREEEVALVERAQGGDRRARDILVVSNLRFVLRIALRYRNSGMQLADLVNEGCIGLIRAMETFSPDRGVRFLSYAVWWIRASMALALDRSGSLIRVPGRFAGRRSAAAAAAAPVSLECIPLADEPEPAADFFEGLSPADHAARASEAVREAQSASGSAVKNPGSSLGGRPPSALAEAVLATLPRREAEVLRWLYSLDHRPQGSMRQLAEWYGLSHQRIRQIREQALARLRLKWAAAIRDFR